MVPPKSIRNVHLNAPIKYLQLCRARELITANRNYTPWRICGTLAETPLEAWFIVSVIARAIRLQIQLPRLVAAEPSPIDDSHVDCKLIKDIYYCVYSNNYAYYGAVTLISCVGVQIARSNAKL